MLPIWSLDLWWSYLRSPENFRRWGLLGWKGFLRERPLRLWLGPLLALSSLLLDMPQALGTTDGALGTLSDCLPFKHEPGQSSLCVAPSRYLVILRRKLTQPASFLFKKGVDGHSLCFYSFLWDGNFSETSEQKETAIKQWRLANSYWPHSTQNLAASQYICFWGL